MALPAIPVSAGALIFDSAGRLLCASQALWIELKGE